MPDLRTWIVTVRRTASTIEEADIIVRAYSSQEAEDAVLNGTVPIPEDRFTRQEWLLQDFDVLFIEELPDA